MLKTKLRQTTAALTALLVLIIVSSVPIGLRIASAEVCPPDRPACGGTGEPSTSSSTAYGPCDTSIDPETLKPKNKLTEQQKRSCDCDGTPNLTEDQIKSCIECKRGEGNCLRNNVIVKRIQLVVNFLSAAAAVVITATIIVGGIQYSLAGDKAESVQAAKKRITNGIIALLLFILSFSLLQWLIPGGIF